MNTAELFNYQLEQILRTRRNLERAVEPCRQLQEQMRIISSLLQVRYSDPLRVSLRGIEEQTRSMRDAMERLAFNLPTINLFQEMLHRIEEQIRPLRVVMEQFRIDVPPFPELAPPYVPEIVSIRSQDDKLHSIVREELERLFGDKQADSDYDPPYGGDGVKRRPGF